MNSFTNICDQKTNNTCIKQHRCISDVIYTFDIETTSLFHFDDGWDVFRYSEPPETYSDMEKVAIPYIWQFGINEDVYYGREFLDFEIALKKISDPNITKIVWVHNLSYEFGFMGSILDKYTITDMCARDVRKPISFYIPELNIIFRCSYMLTNLSLEKSAKEYTDIEKKKSLDYDAKIRTPVSYLDPLELDYCEYDIKCLYEIIKYYVAKYGHVGQIPPTATSEVRQELKHHVDFSYIQHQWSLVPSPNMYIRLMGCFQGGYCHANALNVNKIHHNVTSYDIASSYPTVMCLEKYPATPFMYIDYDDYKTMRGGDYCFMFHVKLHNIQSRYYNNYISFSRCVNFKGVTDSERKKMIKENHLIYDNGRIQKCDMCEMWISNIDLEIIQKNYKIGHIEFLSIYYSEARRLDPRVIEFILELYNNKTRMKNIKEYEDIYKKSKAYINSLYGMSVTNPLKNSAFYDKAGWGKKELTMNFVHEVLNKTKKSYSTLFFYAVGVWVTAYARRNLYTTILSSREFDRDVIYCDTDSIKFKGNHTEVFEEYNRNIEKKYQEVCNELSQLNILDFKPVDPKGIERPLGYFEYEGTYESFKTLGAKKYCYVEDGQLHITVSGVSKKGAQALKSIDDFKKGFTWGYHESGKLAHYYNEDQPPITVTDYEGNTYTNTCKYGVILQPTTYTLGVDDIFMGFYEYIQEKEIRRNEQK
ncbi:MAG: hypothetical protein IKU41_03015 [Clostridia bacterium]|nr:hypothetical protein [Clostridia bacterium]